MKVREEIRSFLTENLLYVSEGFEYGDDTSFIAEGLVDSMGIAELATFVETRYRIPVDQEDVTPENFDSVNRLVGFIRRKQNVQEDQAAYADAGRFGKEHERPAQ